jgi:hypothetical protein
MAFPPNGASPMPPRPPMAGAAPPAAPQPQAQAVASAFHNEVLNRLRSLAPPDKQTLIQGITPPVAMVLKKILPELADIIDKVAPGQNVTQGPPAAAEMAGMESQAAPAPAPRPPFPPSKPSALSRF